MKKKLLITLLVFACALNEAASQETFKIMFYNLLNFPDQSSSKIQDLEVILEDYNPDLFMVCELNNQTGANAILSSLQTINPNYSSATFVTNSSDDAIGDSNDLQNFIYFDSSKFILESQTQIQTIFRDFNHYTFKLNTTDQISNPIIIHFIVCHLKSSQDDPNPDLRFLMVEDLTNYLDGFPSSDYFILGGDLNVYTNSEPAFLELTDVTNNITFIDPANRVGSWHNNITYIDVFTQSTRTQTGLGGATGGFDDRFDFILTSENMLTNPDIFYVNNSYQVYGNNGNINCYNQEINSSNCDGVDFNSTIRNVLYNMSDHLPVILELQTNETLSTNNFNLKQAFSIIGSNIVKNELSIQIDATFFESDFVYIYNTLGQKIITYKVQDINLLRVNVSNLSNGLYYVVASNSNLKPLKFIKSN
ncbi:MAG: hypothetical protein DRI75_07215 [Bacteroidetes bacterium]|nr:MAG: hypothetical protein DRI75_07215 [Bacteroidota bacterium]